METKTLNPYVAPGVLITKKPINETAAILLDELRTNLPAMRTRAREREVVSKRQTLMYLLS